jgi:hypothetical protein
VLLLLLFLLIVLLQHAVCLAREIDLATSWNPAITEMLELAAYSPSELLVRQQHTAAQLERSYEVAQHYQSLPAPAVM